MGARKVVYHLLANDSTVTGLVGTRIYPTVAPQDKGFPAIVYTRVSGVEPGQIDALGAALVQSRIQINAVADGFAVCASVLDAAWRAVRYQHGTIAGVQVVSIVRDIDGVDSFDAESNLYSQSMDVIVSHIET